MPVTYAPPVGGQALIEGVLMRGPDRVAMAARRPDGTITVRVEPLPQWAGQVDRYPIVRGVTALVESIRLGLHALNWSASIAEPRQLGLRHKVVQTIISAVAIVVALGVFSAGPAVVASWTIGLVGPIGRSAVEATLGLALLVGYIRLVRLQTLVRRTFEYHGAEHKAVATHEAGAPLVPDEAARFSIRHARCGTTFLLDVAVLSAVVHIATNTIWPTGIEMVIARVVTIPVVAGLAYELMRATARHADRAWAAALSLPGLALQSLTTGEPDHDQLEVALVALEAALPTGSIPPGTEQDLGSGGDGGEGDRDAVEHGVAADRVDQLVVGQQVAVHAGVS